MGGLRQKNYDVVVFRPVLIGSCTRKFRTAILFSVFIIERYGFKIFFVSVYGRVCVGFGIRLSYAHGKL